MSRNDFKLSRRQLLGTGAGLSLAAFLAGCGAEAPAPEKESDASATETTQNADLDKKAFDALVAKGAVADDKTIASSKWAQKIKDAGTFRLGGVQTGTLFSLLDETDNKLRGFDAGLSLLLIRYILGDESKYEFTKVTSDTRESVLTNDQVDAVFATYSITDDRKKVISFAGPYYVSQQGILVKADNKDINSVDDLAGKNVAVQSGSTGPKIVAEFAPEAKQQEFKTDEEARTALEQGRVDAYVIDATMELSSIVKNPGKYRFAGDVFGPEDKYGIGVPKDSDAVDFINFFLKELYDNGTWAELWKLTIGDRTGVTEVPNPPAIGA